MIRFLSAALLLAVFVGCEKPQSLPPGMTAKQVDSYRSALLLAAEPANAKTVIEVRDALKPAEQPAGDADSEATDAPVTEGTEAATAEVVVMGVIGGMPNPYGDQAMAEFPWVDDQAIFALVDPTSSAEFGDESHQHSDGEECMFCAGKARKLVDTVALVTFVDEEGKPIPVRSDLLLGLKEGSEVVVTGTGTYGLGTLRIMADGVYVR